MFGDLWCINLRHRKFNLVCSTLELFPVICQCQYFQYNTRHEWQQKGKEARKLTRRKKQYFLHEKFAMFLCPGLITTATKKQKPLPEDRNHKINESRSHHGEQPKLDPFSQQHLILFVVVLLLPRVQGKTVLRNKKPDQVSPCSFILCLAKIFSSLYEIEINCY